MNKRTEVIIKKSFIEKLSDLCAKIIPESFAIVLVLTIVVFALAYFFTDSTFVSLATNWYDGFWSMLTFSFQIVMLMFTGYLVGDSRPAKRIMMKLAQVPKTVKGSVLLFWFVMCAISYLHFAIAMASAILFGRALITAQHQKGNDLPYNLIVALGFCSLILQAGPTAGAPLIMAEEGHFMQEVAGVIPLTESMLIPQMYAMNLCLCIAGALIIPLLIPKHSGLLPADKIEVLEKEFIADREELDRGKGEEEKGNTFADVLGNTPIFQIVLGTLGLVVFFIHIIDNPGANFNFNSINFAFMMLAMVLHKCPAAILKSTRKAITITSSVIFQYPFYAGIFGIISYSGLGGVLTQAFVSMSTPRTFTLFVLLFSALLNFAVPSGGSQFMVEAPYIMPAAIHLGVAPQYVLNAFTCGDLLTNLIQPFWALPFISAYNLKFHDVYPYALIFFAVDSIIMIGFFFFTMY